MNNYCFQSDSLEFFWSRKQPFVFAPVYCILIMTYLANAFLLPVKILKAGSNNTSYQIVLLYIMYCVNFLIK